MLCPGLWLVVLDKSRKRSSPTCCLHPMATAVRCCIILLQDKAIRTKENWPQTWNYYIRWLCFEWDLFVAALDPVCRMVDSSWHGKSGKTTGLYGHVILQLGQDLRWGVEVQSESWLRMTALRKVRGRKWERPAMRSNPLVNHMWHAYRSRQGHRELDVISIICSLL